jgi:hypothetical protein
MNLTTNVQLTGQASLFKNSLQVLPRTKAGALNKQAKNQVHTLTANFIINVNNLLSANRILDQHILTKLQDLNNTAHKIPSLGSNYAGGYQAIEVATGMLVMDLGFLLGYLYQLSTLITSKSMGADLNTMLLIDQITLSQLVGFVSLFKNSLQLLPRTKGGAINKFGKVQARALTDKFLSDVRGLVFANRITDVHVLTMMNKLDNTSQKIPPLGSNYTGGYRSIETSICDLLGDLGFLLGYLYALATTHRLKRSGVDMNTLFA